MGRLVQMNHSFNCMGTGIGSLPMTDPDQAAALSISSLPEAPFWPQLPKRSFHEHMDGQYSERLPGLVVDEANKRFSFDTSVDLTPALETFFERYLARDYSFFALSEDYAAGFYGFLRQLNKRFPPAALFFKGHVTGPLTAGISFKDETGKDIIHNELVFDAVVKSLAMKAAWQIEMLKPFGKPVIVFIDEPAIESLGSAFSSASPQMVAGKLNEIIETIHERGGISGIHCCGNADWPMLFNTNVDIVNFDAFGYMERVLLYPSEIRKFLGRGGTLAWGIVPTVSYTGSETADELISRLNAGLDRLVRAGVDRAMLLRQCIITPSCGMGSLTPQKAEAILRLLREVSAKMRRGG
jgi:methionine synthase II (cobalamin-independent)